MCHSVTRFNVATVWHTLSADWLLKDNKFWYFVCRANYEKSFCYENAVDNFKRVVPLHISKRQGCKRFENVESVANVLRNSIKPGGCKIWPSRFALNFGKYWKASIKETLPSELDVIEISVNGHDFGKTGNITPDESGAASCCDAFCNMH